MFADSIEELHRMAEKLGMRQGWFQQGSRLKHYDLVPSKRSKAVSLGAVEVTRYQIVRFMYTGQIGDPSINPYTSGEIER